MAASEDLVGQKVFCCEISQGSFAYDKGYSS